MQQPGFGARCAVHPERSALGVCARCGNFACEICTVGGTEKLCERCRQLSGAGMFPFTRDDFSFDRLWNYCFELWKREWLMLSLCILIMYASTFVGRIFGQIFATVFTPFLKFDEGFPTATVIALVGVGIVTSLTTQLIQGVVHMGLFRVCFDVLHGRPADVGRLFSQLPKAGRYIGLVMIEFALFVIPFVALLAVIFAFAILGSGGSFDDLTRGGSAQKELFSRLMGGAIALWITILLAIPVFIYGWLVFHIAGMEIIYGDCGPFQAIGRAWTLLTDNRLGVVGYAFIGWLVMLLGFFACCIGILPAGGLAQLLLCAFFLALRSGSTLPPPKEA